MAAICGNIILYILTTFLFEIGLDPNKKVVLVFRIPTWEVYIHIHLHGDRAYIIKYGSCCAYVRACVCVHENE